MTTKTQKLSLFLLATATLLIGIFMVDSSFADQATQLTQKENNKVAHDILTQKMKYKDFEDIPLVMSYLDKDGKVVVLVDRNGEETKAEYTKRVKDLVGHDKDVEVHVGWFERDSCANYYGANCDPLYGGIKMKAYEFGTITIGATDDNTVEGFVISSHTAGTPGYNVFQGGTTSTYKVGEVETNPTLDGRYSDAAFVDLVTSNGEDTTDEIFRTSSTSYTVTSTADAEYEDHIQKTGYYTGETSGYVIGTGLTVYADGATNYDQVAANYNSDNGDSGAPVYSYSESAGDVTLYGIHVGKACLLDQDPCPSEWKITVFSQWSNVESELDLDTIP